MKEILLVGFGGIGAVYAFVLKSSGKVNLTVVARSNHDPVQKNGMTFRSDKLGEHIKGWRPDRLLSNISDAADRKYDYVFVATKVVPEVMATEKILSPLLCRSYTEQYGQPIYVLLQNGVGVERGLYGAIKAVESELGVDKPEETTLNIPAKIVSTCVYSMGNLVAPDKVEYVEGHSLTIGVFRPGQFTTTHNNPEEDAILEDLKVLLEAGGTSITVVPEIQRRKLEKNMLNLGFATIATLSNHPTYAMLRLPPDPQGIQYQSYRYPGTASCIEEYTLPNIKAIFMETIAVGRALGFPDSEEGIPSHNATRFLELARSSHQNPHGNHLPSMLLDMRSGKPMEVEVIVGEVVRLAKRVGVDVPRTEMIYSILLIIQNQILGKLAETKS
ncbi:6-phosphogluconate dehydrogenase C-terminal domain-like protein [Marasmius fiardii PR-910]|nr:6-phosphogluconate dehydrogenase C-terminal domain-like protein [Marasmius fiardii PR-910]